MFYGTYGGDDLVKAYDGVASEIGGRYSDFERDRMEFLQGEMAAENATERTKKLYNEIYSPKAQMQQLKDSGISPSIFASGGLAGKSGVSGSQGSGGGGNTGGTQGILGILGAIKDISLMGAEISKTKAEKDLINAQTTETLSRSENNLANTEYQKYINENQNVTNKLTNAFILKDPNDMTTGTSFFDIANASNSYSEYIKAIKEVKWGSDIQTLIHTENGQRVLRDIYINSKEQAANITALNKQQTNDELATKILDVLNKEGYSNLSAQEQIELLKRSVEQNKLDKETSEAWNNLLNKLGDGTKQDTAIVIGLLLRTLIGQTNLNASRSTIVK